MLTAPDPTAKLESGSVVVEDVKNRGSVVVEDVENRADAASLPLAQQVPAAVDSAQGPASSAAAALPKTLPVAPAAAETHGSAALSGAGLNVAVALFVYCVSGTLLTLVNKLAVGAFPAPHSLLLFQNGLTVLLLLALTSAAPERLGGRLPPLTCAAVRTWLPLSLLFVVMLATSLLALQSLSAITLIVMRNLGTLVVAFFESALLGSRVSTLSVASLLGILLGVACYGANDLQFSIVGYAWLAVNIASTAAYQIYVKALLTGIPKEGPDALGPFGMSYFNNVISLPVLLVLALATEAPRVIDHAYALSPAGAAVVVASAFLGLALSTSAFLVNTLVTATTMMVANNVNKFALVVVSEVFMEQTLGPAAAAGTALAVASAWLYSESRGRWATSGRLRDACEALGTASLLAIPLLVALGYILGVAFSHPASCDHLDAHNLASRIPHDNAAAATLPLHNATGHSNASAATSPLHNATGAL